MGGRSHSFWVSQFWLPVGRRRHWQLREPTSPLLLQRGGFSHKPCKGSRFHGWCLVPLEETSGPDQKKGWVPISLRAGTCIALSTFLEATPKTPCGNVSSPLGRTEKEGGSVSRRVSVGSSVMLAWGKRRGFGSGEVRALLCQAPG